MKSLALATKKNSSITPMGGKVGVQKDAGGQKFVNLGV